MSNEPCPMMSIGLTAKDIAKSIAFYKNQLGFELRECWPNEQQPMWCNLVLDGQSVMFGQWGPPEQVEKMCGDNKAAGAFHAQRARQFKDNAAGVGVQIYLSVADIDGYYAELLKRGAKPALPPTTQFYGLRDCVVSDPDGYTLVFFTPVRMSSCQSCGMPLTEAQPGQMYCDYCTDDKGHLKPYEQVFEGTVSGYFMAMQKMQRKDAEKAATEHLAKMPAWKSRGK